jgi:hypothetical protein
MRKGSPTSTTMTSNEVPVQISNRNKSSNKSTLADGKYRLVDQQQKTENENASIDSANNSVDNNRSRENTNLIASVSSVSSDAFDLNPDGTRSTTKKKKETPLRSYFFFIAVILITIFTAPKWDSKANSVVRKQSVFSS